MSIFISTILDLDEIDIGVSDGAHEVKSIITFTSDESESVLVHLTYCTNENFKIEVVDNSDEFEDSKFYYIIHQDSLLEKMIPEKLRELMDDVAFKGEPRMVNPKILK